MLSLIVKANGRKDGMERKGRERVGTMERSVWKEQEERDNHQGVGQVERQLWMDWEMNGIQMNHVKFTKSQ